MVGGRVRAILVIVIVHVILFLHVAIGVVVMVVRQKCIAHPSVGAIRSTWIEKEIFACRHPYTHPYTHMHTLTHSHTHTPTHTPHLHTPHLHTYTHTSTHAHPDTHTFVPPCSARNGTRYSSSSSFLNIWAAIRGVPRYTAPKLSPSSS